MPSLHLNLAGHLLDLNDDELGRLQRCETYDNIDNTEVDIGLSGGFLIALDEVGLTRRFALESALAKESLHKGADVEADLRPQRFIIRFEDHPLRAAIETL